MPESITKLVREKLANRNNFKHPTMATNIAILASIENLSSESSSIQNSSDRTVDGKTLHELRVHESLRIDVKAGSKGDVELHLDICLKTLGPIYGSAGSKLPAADILFELRPELNSTGCN